MVVCDGFTDTDAIPVTLPMPLSIVRAVAPLALQVSRADCPGVIADGFAVKDEITGTLGPGSEFTVTVSGVVGLTAAQMSYLLEAIDWRNPQHTWRPQSAG